MAQFPINEIDIKQFEKGKQIGRGGCGVVYEAKEIKTGQLYAAKTIIFNDTDEMANREISIMFSVNNPTIVKSLGYSNKDFHGDENFTIIMQLAPNGSLSSVLKKAQKNVIPKKFNNTTRQIILIGIARGMKYLHDRNIIHRDLKCGNVLLDKDFHPLITDFGYSKYFEYGHSKSQSIYIGTVQYMAPEVIKGEPYGRKADVYSFGILMYEVVTNLEPYPELTKKELKIFQFQTLVSKNKLRPKFTTPVKEELRNLIEKCWSNDPNDRPTFKEIFNELIENKYFLNDVNSNIIELYVKDITKIEDVVEEKIQIIEKLENENAKLKIENQILKNQKIQFFDSETLHFVVLDNKNEYELIKNEDKITTYKVKSIVTKDGFALLKKIKEKVDCSFDFYKYLIRMNSINCPNIIKAYGVFGHDNIEAILFEYFESKLKNSIKKLNDIQRVEIIYEICFTLKCLIENNLNHNNIDLEYIFLDDKNHVKFDPYIILFKEELRYGIGCLPYMAPEIHFSKYESYKEKEDLYSFGVLMYTILNKGEPPKSKKISNDLDFNEFPKTINNVSKDIIRKCISKSTNFQELLDIINKNKLLLIDGIKS